MNAQEVRDLINTLDSYFDQPQEQRDAAAKAAYDRASANLAHRAASLARAAIGKPFRIRLDKKTVVSGIIVECTPATVRSRIGSIVQQFSVTMECGANKVRRTFNVENLPS